MQLNNSTSSVSRFNNAFAGDDASSTRLSSHTVQQGDTLSALARRYGVSLDKLIDANPQLANPDLIYPGESLNIPRGNEIEVQPGDTLSGLASQHGTTVDALVAANNIDNPNLIYPGDTLRIPQGGSSVTVDPTPGVESTGSTPAAPSMSGSDSGGVGSDTPFDVQGIAGVRNNPNVTPEFLSEVDAMAERLGTKPEYLLAVMSFETGGTFSPSVRNFAGGSATGLIQFIAPTARGLGTSTDQLAQMSSVEQLKFVEKYFQQYAGKLGTLEGVYSSVLSGTATPDPDATLRNFTRGNAAYASNSGLDFNNDGRITSGEATSAVASRLFGGVREVQQQLLDVGAVPAGQRDGFVDGNFGQGTSAAIGNFQRQEGLPVTGLLDDDTGRALFGLNTTGDEPVGATSPGAGGTDLQLSAPIHERSTPGRQFIDSSVIGDFTVTEGFMARGGPHSSKRQVRAIYSENPGVAETVPAGVYNLGIDYVTDDGRIDSWFSGEVVDIQTSNSGYGNRLIARSDQTFNYQGRDYPVYAHYAHADGFTVGEGDRITAGQDIGDQGSTGHSTGDHVDFLTWIELDSGERVFISPNLLSGGS